MYGLMKNGKLIGVHDNGDVVVSCLDNDMYKDAQAIKIKKEKRKEIEKSPVYQDLYLVRFGDNYIPYSLYDTYKVASDEYSYDLKYCRDILFRILEEGGLTEKESKHIMQTLEIVDSRIHDFNLSLEEANKKKELDDAYYDSMYRDRD